MTDETQAETTDPQQPKLNSEERLALAREAGNTWTFKGLNFEREMEMYVATGKATVQTELQDRATDKPSGVFMVHNFAWSEPSAWVTRESAFKTSLKRMGRSTDQEIDTAHLVTVNSALYKSIVQSGQVRIPTGNSEFTNEDHTREDMQQFASLYPEGASEAIETFLEQSHCSLFDNTIGQSFKFLFQAQSEVKVLWLLGSRDPQLAKAAGIFTFKTPAAETRRDFDQAVQRIKSKKQGEISIAELEENFMAKIRYGTMHLLGVEGIAVGEPGKVLQGNDTRQVQEFINLFGPVQFAEAVETMHESFDFMKGRSGLN